MIEILEDNLKILLALLDSIQAGILPNGYKGNKTWMLHFMYHGRN